MGHIFISYSHKDKDYVHRLADALQSEGFEVWIDDRIDYGTRWPLVIENAIDTCEIFILVASENSRASEWVQHELVRAQRLQKQIFPLLLKGDPWISFESTQYIDARDGVLPAAKFYTGLRNYSSRHLEVLRDMIVGSWPIYRSEKFGFLVNYPIGGNLKHDSESVVQINLPIIQGTNLRDKYLSIHCKENGVLSSPLSYGQPPLETSNVEILGHRFLRESDRDGAEGTHGEWVSYSTSRGSKVVTCSITLITTSYHAYFPELLPRIDLAAEKETLLYVISTFSWLS